MKVKLKSSQIINIFMVAIFLVLLTFITLKYGIQITKMIRDPRVVAMKLRSYGSASAFVYILLQITHVVIFIIPGELVQIAGGYVYGTFLGTVYSMIGLMVGMFIVFYASRLIGYRLINSIVPKKSLKKFNFLINSPKSEIIMFVLFLIPGLPKDALVYIAGITPIKPIKFFTLAAIARFPGILGSSIIGISLQRKNYLLLGIVSVVTLVLFVGGLLTKDKIIDKLHHLSKSKESNEDKTEIE